MNKRTTRGFAFFCLAFGGLSSSYAQAEQQPLSATYRLDGEQIHRSILVRSFLSTANSILLLDPNFQWFLNKIGIGESEEGMAAFLTALTEALVLEYGPSGPNVSVSRDAEGGETLMMTTPKIDSNLINGIDPATNPKAFDKAVHQAEFRRAYDLGRVYGRLQRRLEDAGLSIDGIEAYIEERTRPGSGVVSDEPWVGRNIEDWAAFEDGWRLEMISDDSTG